MFIVRRPRGALAELVDFFWMHQGADATYERALDNGATPISVPEEKPFRERVGGVRDAFGNLWFISTYLGAS